MKNLQKLGKSLMLPVACLPIAAIFMGIGYWIDPSGFGANNVFAAFLLQAGGAIIGNMAILFAIGVAIGMAKDNDGTAALAGLLSWLMITTLLSPSSVAMFQNIAVENVNPAFGNITNQFIGILAGLIGAICYNNFNQTKLPDYLAFFSGKRSVAIVAGGVSVLVSVALFFLWPFINNGLVAFGTGATNLGALGAGIYLFFNRLLIPFGLHHTLNSVFLFDIAGINDLPNFWSGTGVYGEAGVYMTGGFPVLMFGLPAACLAMYHVAKPSQKNVAKGLLLSAALSSFLVGITEPIEFSFMFLAPALYVVHALLTGTSAVICALLPVRVGVNFSNGFIDWFLSYRAPMAQNPWLIIPLGVAFAVIYYLLFRIIIVKFNLMTPGRLDEDYAEAESKLTLNTSDYAAVAATILEGLGGPGNIVEVDNCITRLRTEVKDYTAVNEKIIKSTGTQVIRPSKTSVQVVVGMQVQHVTDELKRLMKESK